MSAADAADAPAGTLERVRTEPRTHAAAALLAVVVGLAAAWLHWLGLIVGGALVGLTAASLPRALVGGVGFGLLALVAFAVSLGGDAFAVVEMVPAVYVTVAAGLGLPLLGSLVRGVV